MFQVPSIPFYLKAIFLLPLVTSGKKFLQESFSRQIEPGEINLDPGDIVLKSLADMHPNEMPMVVNPIPDQFVQIGAEYTYGLSRVFSGDEFQILAMGLPNWLKFKYQELGAYPIKDGYASGIDVSGNIAFVANRGAGVLILNVSNRSYPQKLSIYSTGSGLALEVVVSDNTLFVANNDAGLLILNVTDPSYPQKLSTYSTGSSLAVGVAVSGNSLFVANGDAGILILNVSNPSYPQKLSTFSTGSNFAYLVAISGNALFVGNEDIGLLILNVSDPSHPQELSNCVIEDDFVDSIAVSGSTAFLARLNALLILNVTDFCHPQKVSTCSIDDSFATGVALSGNTLFVTNENGLEIFDLRSGILIGTPSGVASGQTSEVSIIAQEKSGSLIMDAFKLTADSYLPQLVKNTLTDQSIFPDELLPLLFESRQLFNIPDTSFLAFSLEQVNRPSLPAWITLETNPTLLSSYSAVWDDFAVGVALSGNIAFVANGYGGLLILNVSDLSHPQNLSTYSTGSNYASSVAVSGNIVFVTNGLAGLLILNVSDPFHPQKLSNYSAGGNDVNDVAISGNIVFLANGPAGLLILNVSDPFHPQKLSNYSAGGNDVNNVAISGNIVFLANGPAGLLILNVTDLVHPQKMSTYAIESGFVSGVVISDNIVFVVNREADLLILNVSNPFRPQKLSTYSMGRGFANGLVVLGKTVFMASDIGLLVLNVRDLANPRLQGSYPTENGFAYGGTISISGNTIFLANGKAGLNILGISNRYSLKIKATPSRADTGNYPLVLKAIDEVGASASIPFTIRVEGPPRVISNITWQYVQVGEIFTFNIPSDTFFDPNYDPLVFSLNVTNQAALPTWLSFNKISVTLVSNQPDLKDRSTYALRLTAIDPRGGSAFVDFNLTVVNAPQLIPDQPFLLVQKRHFHRSIPLGAIFDGAGQVLHYNLSLPEQGKSGLSWLQHSIVDSNLDLWGTPANITGSLTVIVTASTSLGYRDSTPITLSINPNFSPQVKEPIPSQSVDVGGRLDFPLPSSTFEDLNGDPLSYSVLADGAALPNWLKFSQEKESWHFIAEPGGWDTNAFSSRAVMIQITARDTDNATVTTSFNLNVGGTSTIGLLLRIGTPILSLFALFQKRAAFLNRLCYNRYQKDPHTLEIGQQFSIRLSTPADVVSSIEVKTRHLPATGCSRVTDCQRFFKPPINYLQLPFDALPEGTPLPDWMKYRKIKNTIEGVLPAQTGYRELVVIVKNNAGVVKEQFALKLEKGAVVRRDRRVQERTQGERELEDLELSDDPEVGYVIMQ